MKVISGIEAYDGNKKTAVTLGKFDGLHRGHQKLLEKVLSYRGDGCEAVVCAFDMHRDSLMTVRERRAHLSGKTDWLIEQTLSGDFMSMEAEAFIEEVLIKSLSSPIFSRNKSRSFSSFNSDNAPIAAATTVEFISFVCFISVSYTTLSNSTESFIISCFKRERKIVCHL